MSFSDLISTGLDALSSAVPHNRYSLKLNELNITESISVHAVAIDEQLNQPWRYTITFTSCNHTLAVDTILNKPASFSFLPAENSVLDRLFDASEATRTVYGVVTAFSLLSTSQEETRYQIILQPRVALLSNSYSSAIYQNQSVISVVESLFRQHGLTGIDYRLELKETYPNRELITQWQESDLVFIQRLLADVGISLFFETHPEHHCDVVVLSDEDQRFKDYGTIIHQKPSGMMDSGKYSVWALARQSSVVNQSVTVNNYNYREAKQNLLSQVNTAAKDTTTYGNDYRYGEDYKHLIENDEDSEIESGQWFAAIRHQQVISQQRLIRGKSNDYRLAPGQRRTITNSSMAGIEDGIIILTTKGYGDRSQAYEIEFTAIAFDVLKPYRPAPLPMPKISGTLPARITSPDNDTYGYIDTHGRYRVKFNFDLANWRSGEESLWVRLARPYAGNQYGFHFPLIDGTEVAIAFTDQNPNRPYIAFAFHDSAHPDLITAMDKHRNVIRTPANNELRMDDKRGQEHIKLATEYAKTQLNLGHLVDKDKNHRGEGFELRTDQWGGIAANKGLYLTSQTEPKAQGKQLDMQGAMVELENALSIAKALHSVAESAQSHTPDTESQQQLQSSLSNLTQSGMLAYAQEGMALISPQNIQLTTGNSLSIISTNQTDITALKNITVATPEAISLLAQKSGMKLIANEGDIDIQAQSDQMALAAKQNIKIDSEDSQVDFSAAKEITLMCGGSYIKISSEGIELGTQDNIYLKCNVMQKMGATTETRNTKLPSSDLDVHGCVEKGK
ncbi:hypothetical protein A9G34_03980 [Gilliamella sp. Choc4-2]|uniref:type VI secretion system Vgr family protein n=1 Tax=Gilliamella sp. Choc4-2 TaxID=3120237 RepID=UPI00080EA303|nr:type VI secretion system Vgr family protein [Gilliamella apicola]OCG46689.1 hypothetical protein A9G34_03980 [Gilliamella apicola]